MGLFDEADTAAAAAVSRVQASREQEQRDRTELFRAMSPLLMEARSGLLQRNVPPETRHCGSEGWGGFTSALRGSYFLTEDGELRRDDHVRTYSLNVELFRITPDGIEIDQGKSFYDDTHPDWITFEPWFAEQIRGIVVRAALRRLGPSQ